ncbi:MAG: DUF1028 domain-containing protein, partial [candidate division Zixibacteria bacterium]|nr:DUF1028 domain-containing protein [candidate division Zixibacteria bacterium]
MKKCLIAFFVIVLLFSVARAEDIERIQPFYPVNTYSIVCYDSATGQFGAAVQSHWFKVADVIWAEPDVGVVATQ